MVTVWPALASAPVPTIRSLMTSFFGGGPLGGVTTGFFDSGPLVGVFGSFELVSLGSFFVVDFSSALSALFSLPTVIVEEPPEPQPASSAAASRPARGRTIGIRRGVWEERLELDHGGAA